VGVLEATTITIAYLIQLDVRMIQPIEYHPSNRLIWFDILSQVTTVSVEGGLVGTPDPGQKLPRIRANMATWDQEDVTGSTTGWKRDFDGGEVALESVSEVSGMAFCGVCDGIGSIGFGVVRIGTGRGSR